ncbi:lck-interacting transmembrane adapter 1 [Leptonychotes weddellii]|uniref:Lck-interacting transmembrane adapter 1 n=1 Tax=Leptonychotes weddellii TaxID=9713 RepID=A0A7F8Q2Z4_LEPWE|nr:lck-interacting transmembrane adapter 1 [Leptonychotes weddellii]
MLSYRLGHLRPLRYSRGQAKHTSFRVTRSPPSEAYLRLRRMGPQVPSAPPALWVLGCLALSLWLWTLCTACHRKRVQRQRARPQGGVMPAEASLLRRHHFCTLSKSDTRLHELHPGPAGCRAPRPASMDILRPQWLEVPRGTSRPMAAFSHRELPQAMPAATSPSICPEATYSNVGLAAIPRASLAASPVVWAGARLTSSCARPGPEARPEVAEYACIQKLKETDQGPQSLGQGKAKLTPAVQVDILYSRVRKPKKRDPGPATDQLDPKGRGVIPPLGSDQSYETLPLRGLGKDDGLLENVYESIQEMPAPSAPAPGALLL